MSERLTIKSLFREYVVRFTDDAFQAIEENFRENTFFIADRIVADLNQAAFTSAIPEDRKILIEANELNKSMDYCQGLIRRLVDAKVRKNHTLVAIGGGIVQDITAFTASILYRGIRWDFIPTTLLAQADSCIGSKTSINLGNVKNLVGNFYPPSMILIDVDFLKTLDQSEIKSGIGEMLHYFLIADNPMAGKLMENYDELLTDPEDLSVYIKESLRVKKQVIERDEFDQNERNLFNYGHTFGHAIEAVSGYDINHGQAVTMGMDIANYIAMNLGYLKREIFESMHKILAKNMPSFHLQADMEGIFFAALSKDKKNIGENLGCILTSGPGSMKKIQIPFDDKLKNLILSYFKFGC